MSRVAFTTMDWMGSRQVGIKAKCDIESGAVLFELCAMHSLQVPMLGNMNSVCASREDDMTGTVLLGPGRLLNHSCEPNAWVRPA